jgi:hypothetical protein
VGLGLTGAGHGIPRVLYVVLDTLDDIAEAVCACLTEASNPVRTLVAALDV